MKRTVLFLCTGNYYRSRFAEELFNHLAPAAGLQWQAASRALAIEKGSCNIGPLSPHAHRALEQRGIPLSATPRAPMGCTPADMEQAYQIIALKEAEHRQYILARHPAFADRVEYWHVHDLDRATAEEAIPQIERQVIDLIKRLSVQSAT